MTTLFVNRYQILEHVGTGGMGTIHAAYDRLKKEKVALKQLAIPDELFEFMSNTTWAATLDYRLPLAKEFQTLASLHHPNIVNVLDYGFDRLQKPYFTMELLVNSVDLLTAAANRHLPEQIELIIQVLQALAYLHRRSVVHRDLKSDNIRVIADEVKMLDFGLAISRKLTEETDTYSGTLTHMAPEVLDGHPATPATDLYAIGIIMYEMFGGRHPFDFDTRDIVEFKNVVRTKQPEISSLSIPASVADVIKRLLAKRPEERFQQVEVAIQQLSLCVPISIPLETTTIRDSYLQAADFVGRDVEIHLLVDAFNAIQKGHGSAWLIGGEEGVGKTRLLSEFRIQVAVKGALILDGQVDHVNPGRYQPWQNPLRQLVLAVEPTDFEANVLQSVIPDIGNLLDRHLTEQLYELNPDHAQARLFNTVVDLLRRLHSPVIILLEDLHWANEESLLLLEWISRMVAEDPIMLVASYRTEESPKLPNRLYQMKNLTLSRLGAGAVASLTRAMLGKEHIDEKVFDVLQQETGGNAFFIVEVMRALSERTAYLQEIDRSILPENLLVGGIHMVLKSRLGRISDEDRNLLNFAATTGHWLDIHVIQDYAGQEDISAWLTRCSERAVLEVQQGIWRFSHDKLRDVIINELPIKERKRLHRDVAEAIMRLYSDQIPEQSDRLALHWDKAGDAELAYAYHLLAGREAAAIYANKDAINHLTRAKTLAKTIRFEVVYELAHVLIRVSAFQEAVTCLQDVLGASANTENEAIARTNCLNQLGQLLVNYHGKYEEGLKYIEDALGEFKRLDHQEGIGKVYIALATVAIARGDYISGMEYLEDQYFIAERIGNIAEISLSLRMMGNINTQIGDYDQALQLMERSLKIAISANDISNMARSLASLGIFYMKRGALEKALGCLVRQLEHYNQMGDIAAISETILTIGRTYVYTEQYDKALQGIEYGLVTSSRIGDWLGASTGLIYRAECLTAQEKLPEALFSAELAIQIVRKLRRKYHLCDYLRIGSNILFQMKNYTRMITWSEEALKLAERIRSSHFLLEAKIANYRALNAIGELNDRAYINQLSTLINMRIDVEKRAEIQYLIWKVNPALDITDLANLYKELYNNSPQSIYRQRYETLTNEPLDQPIIYLPDIDETKQASASQLKAAISHLEAWIHS